MAFDRLFETILLTNEHNWSLESPMTRNDSVRFVPRARGGQQCKKRRTSWAGYDFVPKLGRYSMRCGLYIGRAYVDGPPFWNELTAISKSIDVTTTTRVIRSDMYSRWLEYVKSVFLRRKKGLPWQQEGRNFSWQEEGTFLAWWRDIPRLGKKLRQTGTGGISYTTSQADEGHQCYKKLQSPKVAIHPIFHLCSSKPEASLTAIFFF